MKLQEKLNFDLSALNSFGLKSKAVCHFELSQITDLPILRNKLIEMNSLSNFYIMGGGSNLILSELIQKPVIQVNIKGIRIMNQTDQHITVEVAAGEIWTDFVEWTVKNNYLGLENLVLIPGTVGAAPVQNIGAYGVEVGKYISAVKYFDFQLNESRTLSQSECDFSYRHSVFKSEDMQTQLITHVIFRLNRPSKHVFEISYKELKEKFSSNLELNGMDVLEEVKRIRTLKLPDPKVIGNVGSFFKNPLISKSKLDQLLGLYPQLPFYPTDGESFKISAGWMIDQLGWKGQKRGAIGVYERQALVLVKCSEPATANDVKTISQEIIDSVLKHYSVQLEIEPIQWN